MDSVCKEYSTVMCNNPNQLDTWLGDDVLRWVWVYCDKALPTLLWTVASIWRLLINQCSIWLLKKSSFTVLSGMFIGDTCYDPSQPDKDWKTTCSEDDGGIGDGAICDPSNHICVCKSGWMSDTYGTKCTKRTYHFLSFNNHNLSCPECVAY